MSKTFDDTCRLTERIPTMELTVHFFWSVMCEALNPKDRVKLVEELMERVTEDNSEQELAEQGV